MQGAVAGTSNQARVTDGLRARITGGTLEAGAALSEAVLAEEFGVSRTPVREAIKQLQTEGLLVIRPRVGTFVATPTRLEINELYEMKEILEGAAARLFALRGKVPELSELRDNVQRSAEAVSAQDASAYALLVEEFHGLVIRGAANTKLSQHYRTMMNQLAYPRMVQTTLARPGRLVESETEHDRVLDAIAAKDGTTAERIMREHVRHSREVLLDAMTFPDEAGTR
jgi:DNA-binding GntR family transcriptional regulator